MDADELREAIWKYLYQSQNPRTVDEIAVHAGRDVPTVREVIDHEWFNIAQDRVSIAYT